MIKDYSVLPTLSKCQLFLAGLLTLIFAENAFAQKQKEISKSVYFTANTGVDNNKDAASILAAIVAQSKNDKNAAFVAIGNITKNGFPKKDAKRSEVKDKLQSSLLKPLEGFNGQLIFTPGYNEWQSGGHQNIDDMESFLQDNSKAKFWPNDGCPIERETLSDEVELLMIDSQWYLEDWDKHPYINNKCEIKTREQFLEAFKDELKDEQNKTIIVAVHHPVITDSKKGFIERMGGFTNQSFYSIEMQAFVGRLETAARQFNDVIFVSGNDHNLQYLEDKGMPQIISGVTSNSQSVRPHVKKGFYGTELPGYAKLNVFKDGSSQVELYTIENGTSKLAYSHEIQLKKAGDDDFDYKAKSEYGKTQTASIYTQEEVDRSGIYKAFWGQHYRDVYGKEIKAPVLFLDDMPNNVQAISEGGGNQSRSLRLQDDKGHEYTARELRKSAVRFIQHSIKDHYVMDLMSNTVADELVTDYYTTSHPYAQYAANELMDALNIYHANPKIVFIPKQKRLGRFNESYGDKLYMIEEYVGDENKDYATFGKPDDIISTTDLQLKLMNKDDVKVDETAYLKARLFDILVGDWDRHSDQWKWSEFEQKDGSKKYVPIAKDRDQAFAKYDGIFPALLKMGAPLARNMQSYAPEVQNIRTFNNAVYYLDKNFIHSLSKQEWIEQATYIQNKLTDQVIDQAFGALLADTQDETTAEIKSILKQRRDNLVDITQDYYEFFMKHEVIVATTKDNIIDVVRMNDGITKVTIKEDDKVLYENTYDKNQTKEIWLYALDGDDKITVSGKGNNPIKLKIFGGEENDIYTIENRSSVKVYDYKSKENTFNTPVSKFLTDSYDINNYDAKKRKYSELVVLPTVGFNRDTGFNAGLSGTVTTYSLLRNPFTTRQKFSAQYYSATQGYEFGYNGEFAHVFKNVNFGLDARYTTDNFALNFFGIGNETFYDEDVTGFNFYRTKIQQWHVAPSLIFTKGENLSGHVKGILESNEVDNEDNGFVQTFFPPTDDVFERQHYAGGEVGIMFNNKRGLTSYPRRGMELGLLTGYKSSIDKDFDNKFAYVTPTASFIYPIHKSGAAAIATKASANFIIGDNYEFYHAATVGGVTSLRGYRNDRFQGQTSFYQSTDLRVGITKFRTNFIPIRLGVTAGFDYGRVWSDIDNSSKWHKSYGGSVFINGFSSITANIGYYVSEEDNRLIFTAGFRF